jgi:hypothetical protein
MRVDNRSSLYCRAHSWPLIQSFTWQVGGQMVDEILSGARVSTLSRDPLFIFYGSIIDGFDFNVTPLDYKHMSSKTNADNSILFCLFFMHIFTERTSCRHVTKYTFQR